MDEDVQNGRVKANLNGQKLENLVADFIRGYNIPVYKYGDLNKTPNNPCLIRNVPYINLYGLKGFVEFVLYLDEISVRIECKYQNVPGSVIEKLPYVIETAIQAEEDIRIVILDGAYYNDHHYNYMEKRALESGEPVFVFTLQAFKDWFNATVRPLLKF